MTATLLLPHDGPREDWLKLRREGIGASEIAAVMGISPYDSPFSLWWRKHMGWDTEPNTEMTTGTFLETTIARWFTEATKPQQDSIVAPGGLYAAEGRPWQLATPDRLLADPCGCCWNGNCKCGLYGNCSDCMNTYLGSPPFALLECKWVAYSWDGWGEDGTSVIPVHYRAQVQWQMDVMEVAEVFVCALGPGGFRTYRIQRDDKDVTAMREAGRRFMESLAEGTPPDVDDHTATLPMLRRVHGTIEDREQEIPSPIAAGWLRAKRFKDLATRVEKRYAAQLRAHLGTAKTAVCDGRTIAARTADDKLTRKS